MCQLGADQMGVEGHGYREILAFYYPGAVLGLTARGLAWQRMGGERVALMTTQPGRDAAVLETAERQVREIADQYRVDAARRHRNPRIPRCRDLS